MRVVWTYRARRRLKDIRDHIGQYDKATGKRIARSLADASKRLGQSGMARSGRMVPEYGDADIRELIEEPYRIIHVVMAERIDVLSVMHSRQLLPLDPDDLW